MLPFHTHQEPDGFIRTTQIEKRVVFSLMHVRRLEAEGRFPKRMTIGRSRSVAWSLRDVLQWMQARLDERPSGWSTPVVTVDPSDRFISVKEVCAVSALSKQQIDRLEARSEFPRRAQIGPQRVAWLEREVQDWLNDLKVHKTIHSAGVPFNGLMHIRRFNSSALKIARETPHIERGLTSGFSMLPRDGT